MTDGQRQGSRTDAALALQLHGSATAPEPADAEQQRQHDDGDGHPTTGTTRAPDLLPAEIDRVGCFQYEPVAGAASNEIGNPVPEDIKDERWHRLMAVQQAISERRLQRRVGAGQLQACDPQAQGRAIIVPVTRDPGHLQ